MKLLIKVVKDSYISQTIKVLMIYQIFPNSDLEKHKYMQWHRIVIDAIKFKFDREPPFKHAKKPPESICKFYFSNKAVI